MKYSDGTKNNLDVFDLILITRKRNLDSVTPFTTKIINSMFKNYTCLVTGFDIQKYSLWYTTLVNICYVVIIFISNPFIQQMFHALKGYFISFYYLNEKECSLQIFY